IGANCTPAKPIVVDVKNAGGEFYDQEVVVDNEQLVTSRTPDDLPAFNREALRLLGAGITPPV
ncbi:DJ-1/PfpI family protein, partial [Klebsiella pneumoniae]